MIPVAVGSLSQLSFAHEMEENIIELSQAGKSDKEIAEQLTAKGFRSPMGQEMLPSTVKSIRLKRRVFQKESQSHPLGVTGFLTVTQIAKLTNVSVH